MSTTIDQRVVEMRFDNKQFETNVQNSMSSIDKLKQSLNLTGASKGLESIDAAAKKCDMSGLSNAVQTVQAKFSALQVIAVTAFANITNSVLNTGKKIVSALTVDPIKTGLQEYETQINAVQTILANTSGKGTTLNQVNAALDELNTYADKTIYNFTEMTKNIGTFTAAGVDLKTSVEAIKGIANLAAVSGSNAQQASTAMYQLSQALSSGTVKLMDWNSVVNAGMGGQVFQDSLKETARVHDIAIDDMIKSEGSFRETLKDGWLSSKILTETLAKFTGDLTEAQLESMGYTKEQIVDIIKLGQMANDAATKVKTFTQLCDTLKEAAQSGWSQSWKLILGDFEEAKKLWTDMSNVLGKIIGDSADARNEMLSGGLSSGWNQFLREGIADEAGYIDTIKEVAKEHNIVVDDLIKDGETFEDSLKKGWLTSDIMSESLKKLTDKTKGLSDEELKNLGYTRQMVDEIEGLNASVQNGSISVEEFAQKMKIASGRENLIEALRNSFEALMSAITPISQAFREIFPPYTSEQLYALTEIVCELTKSFKLSDETSANLKSTFKGLFAVLDIAKQAFSAIFKAISPLFGGLNDLGGGILEVTANWGDWLVKLRDTIETTGIFNDIMQNVVDFVKIAKNAMGDFIKTVKENVTFPGFELFHSFLERVHKRMSQIGETAGDMKSGVVAAVDIMGESLANSQFLQMLQSLWNGVKTIAGGIASAFGSLTSGIVEKIGNADFKGAIDIINSLIAGGIGVGLMKFINAITKVTKEGNGFLGGIKDLKDAILDTFGAIQTTLKADTLIKIASAIAILAASILVISLIDSDKLSVSLGAITVIFADLIGSMAIFEKISGKAKRLTKTCSAMISISIAVLILANALKKVGELNAEQLKTGLIGVIGLTAMMVAAAKIMGSGTATIIKGATQMVIFAAAIKILASACTGLSNLNWEQLKIGLVGIGVLLGEVALFMNFAKFSGKSITTATGIVILSEAIKILASACVTFGEMDWDKLKQGLVAIGVLLTEITLFTNLTGNAKHVISTGVALIAISAAMNIFASALKDFGTMQWDEIGRGLTAMAGALLAVTLAVKFIPKNIVGVGIGLIAVATSLIILATALDKMGDMQWDEIGRGLTVLGGSMAILAIGLKVMTGTLAGSAAMLVATVALAALTPVLSILGAMSWEAIVKGLTGIAGAFTVIGVAGLVLTPLVPTILALGGALALIGVGVLGIGAGLLAAGAGLSALAIGFTGLATAGIAGATAIVASLTVIITGVAGLIPLIVVKIGEGIIELCKVIAKGAPEIGEAVKAIVLSLVGVLVECVPALADGALELVTGVLASLVKCTPQIVDSIFQFLIGLLDGIARNLPELIKTAIDVLMSFFSGIVDALSGIDVEVLLKGIVGIGLLSAIMIALAAVAALIPAAMVGLLGMGVVIAELALVLAAIGALAQISGLKWLINEGAELMQGIGNAIGSFIGGIVGGFMNGVSSSFPKIADDLSAFMNNIQPFVEGARQIDASVMDGVKALAETILILTAANILEGLTSWFTGSSSMTKFGQELAEFGPYFKQYYESIKGVDGSVVESSANAALALAEFAKEIPNSGGVVGWFAGENSLSAFAEELMEFGPKLKAYADSVRGVDGSVVENSANAAKALAEMSNNLPNQGGAVSWFTGDNTLSMFGEELMAFGPSLKAYADSVRGLDGNVVTNSANAAKALAELSTNLPNTGGIVSWFTGDNDIASFGEQLVSFGQSFSSYYKSISTVNTSKLSAVLDEFGHLVNLAAGIENVNTGAMTSFGKSLTAIGNSGVEGFISSFTDSNLRVTAAAKTLLTTFISGMSSKKTELIANFTILLQTLITTANSKKQMFTSAGQNIMLEFLKGINSKELLVSTTMVTILNKTLIKIRSKNNEFYNAGSYLVSGFASGISANTYKVAAKAKAMAGAAARAAKSELKIHSPSKVFYGIGDYSGQGFIDALSAYKSKAYGAGSEIAKSAKDGLTKAVSKISNVINGDFNEQPTIRPVLDLSNVQNGVNSLYRLTDSVSSFSILGAVNSTNQLSARMNTAKSMSNEDNKSKSTITDPSGYGKIENTFHISGDNPREIAAEVSRIIQRQVERRVTSWA